MLCDAVNRLKKNYRQLQFYDSAGIRALHLLRTNPITLY